MKKITPLFLLTMFAASNANASGYQLNEYSVTGLGRAFSGSGVVGDDYSAIAFNPAGMTLKGNGIQAGLTSVEMHSDLRGRLYNAGGTDITNGPKGRMRVYKTLPHAFGQYKVNDKFYLGLGSYTPFGLASIYNGDWFGSSHGIKTELTVIDNALAGAYKINDKWSIGSAIILRYVRGDLINALSPALPNSRNRMDLDGWGLAYNFGVMYEPVKDTRFGVAYRLNSAHTVKGNHTIRRTGAAGLDGTWDGVSQMTLPNQLTLSAFHKLNDSFGLSATARWTKWNIFDDFVMASNRPAYVSIPEKWKNVWTYSLGVDYYYDQKWTFRTGLSMDPSPIKNEGYRTARIPDSDRTWATLGASYKYKNMTFDFGYAHLFMKTASIHSRDHSTGTTLIGKASSLSNMYGVQFQYDF